MVRAVLTGRSTVSGFDLAWFSSLSSKRFCIFGLHGAVYVCVPPTKEEVHVFARVLLSVCLSVCLLARLLKNACMDLNEMLLVDR